MYAFISTHTVMQSNDDNYLTEDNYCDVDGLCYPTGFCKMQIYF